MAAIAALEVDVTVAGDADAASLARIQLELSLVKIDAQLRWRCRVGVV